MTKWKSCFAGCFGLPRGRPAASDVASTQPHQSCPPVDAQNPKAAGNGADHAEEISLYAFLSPAKSPSVPHVLPNTAQFAFCQSLPQSSLSAADYCPFKDAQRPLQGSNGLANDLRPVAEEPRRTQETSSWPTIAPPFLWPSVRGSVCAGDGTSSTTPAQQAAARASAADQRSHDSSDGENDPTYDNADYTASRASDSNCSLDINTPLGSVLYASSRSTTRTLTMQQTMPAAGTSPPSFTAATRLCACRTSPCPQEEPGIRHLSTRSSGRSAAQAGRSVAPSVPSLSLSSPSNPHRQAGGQAPRLTVYCSLAAMLADLQGVRLLRGAAGGAGDIGGVSADDSTRGRCVALRGRLTGGPPVIVHLLGCCALHPAAGPALRNVMVAGSAVHPTIAKVHGMRFLPAAAAAAFRCPPLPSAAAAGGAPSPVEAEGLAWGRHTAGHGGGGVPSASRVRVEAGPELAEEVEMEADAAAEVAVGESERTVESARDGGDIGPRLAPFGLLRKRVTSGLSCDAAAVEWPRPASGGPASPYPVAGVPIEVPPSPPLPQQPLQPSPQQQQQQPSEEQPLQQQPQPPLLLPQRYHCGGAAAGRTASGSNQLPAIVAALQQQLRLRPGDGVLAVVYEGSPMGSLESLLGGVHNPFRPNRSWPAYMARRALLRTAMEVARALAHLHARGFVHGCLRPCNVLLVPSSQDRRNFRAKVVGACIRLVNLLGASHSAASLAVGGCCGSARCSGPCDKAGSGCSCTATGGGCDGDRARCRSISSPQPHIATTGPWPPGASLASREHPRCALAIESPYTSSPQPSLPIWDATAAASNAASLTGNGSGAGPAPAQRLGAIHPRMQASQLLLAATAALSRTAASDSDAQGDGGFDFNLALALGEGSCPGRPPRLQSSRALFDTQQAVLNNSAAVINGGSNSGGGGVSFRRPSRRLLLTGFAIPEQLEMEAAEVAEAEAHGDVGRRRSDGSGGGSGISRCDVAAGAWGPASTRAVAAGSAQYLARGFNRLHRGDDAAAAAAEAMDTLPSPSGSLSYSNGPAGPRCVSSSSAAAASAAPRLVSLLRAVMSGRATNTDTRDPAAVQSSYLLVPRAASGAHQSSVASLAAALLSRRPSFLASSMQDEADLPRLVSGAAAVCSRQHSKTSMLKAPSQTRAIPGLYDNALLASTTPTPGASPCLRGGGGGGGLYGSNRAGDVGHLALESRGCSSPQVLLSSAELLIEPGEVSPALVAAAAGASAAAVSALPPPPPSQYVASNATASLSGASNAFLTGTATCAATTGAGTGAGITTNCSTPASFSAATTAINTTSEGTFGGAPSAAAPAVTATTVTAATTGLDSQPSLSGASSGWPDELFVCPEAQLDPYCRADPSHDTWAFGMLLWAMAARGPPTAEPEQCPPKALKLLDVELDMRAPEWPCTCLTHTHLRQLYEACVATNPSRRPSMSKVLTQLEQLEKQLREDHTRSQKAATAAAVGGFLLLDRRRAMFQSQSHAPGQGGDGEERRAGGGLALLRTMPANLRAAFASQHRQLHPHTQQEQRQQQQQQHQQYRDQHHQR